MADASENQDITKMKVAELKKLLKDRGLPFSGNKPELVARLQESLGGEAVTEAEADDVLNEEAEDGDISVDPGLEEDLLTDKDNSISKSSDTTSPVPEQQEAEKPKIVKLGAKTESEKLAARAERFGNISEVSKKQARADRFGISVSENKDSASSKTSKAAPLSNTTTMDAEKLKKRAERFGGSVSGVYSQVESLDKMKKRAERFGQVTSTELNKVESQDRLLKRKERFGAALSAGSGTSSTDEQTKKKSRAERFGLVK